MHEQDAPNEASLGGTIGFMLGDCVRIQAFIGRQIVLRYDRDGFDL